MIKIKPNQICPCGSQEKYKKCCAPYIAGQVIDHPERILRVRYTALAGHNAEFLWGTLHPNSPRKIHDTWRKFESEQEVLSRMTYEGLTILDGDVSQDDRAVIVFYIKVKDGDQDLSYLEEAEYRVFEGVWYYFDGLRRAVKSVKCDPLSVKVGQLETFFQWDAGFN